MELYNGEGARLYLTVDERERGAVRVAWVEFPFEKTEVDLERRRGPIFPKSRVCSWWGV